MKKLLKKYGFTLVELIVVIVILAVLAALAFMIVNKWIGASKDTKRIQDLSAINISFNLYMTNHSSYPFPDADNEEGTVITGTINGQTVLYKGTIGENVIKNLGNTLTKVPLDPIGKRYAYGITASGKEYEIGTVLENEIKLGILNEAYALNYKARLEGLYRGMIVFSTGGKQYIANIPSLVFTVSGSVANSMNMLSSNIYYAINSGNNLPYIVTTKSDAQKDNMSAVIRSKTNSITAIVEPIDITNITDLSNTFSGDRLISFGGNLGIIQNVIKDQSGQTTTFASPGTAIVCTCTQLNAATCEKIFDGNTWGTCSVKTCDSGYTLTAGVCEESACGGTPSGSTNNFYDVSSVPYVDNNCPAHMKTFTCDKGEWKDGLNPADTATYQYLACSRGIPTNCSATTYNGYTIPDTTHALSGSATKDVSENNGTFRYTQNFECNNGIFNYTSQTGPEYVSCNTNYHREGGNCTSDAKSVSCNGTAPSGSAYTLGASSISITWNGTARPAASSWTYGGTSACQYTCATNYTRSSGSCNLTNYFAGAGTSGDPYRIVGESASATSVVATSCNYYNLNATTLNYGSVRGTGSCGNGSQACLADGIYRINPQGGANAFNVYCDMSTDLGGWTLLHVYNSANVGSSFYSNTVFSSDNNLPLSPTGSTGTHNWNKFSTLVNSSTLLRYTNNKNSVKRYEKNLTWSSFTSAPSVCSSINILGGDNNGTKVDSTWNGSFATNARGNGHAYNGIRRGPYCLGGSADAEGLGLRYLLLNGGSATIGSSGYDASSNTVIAWIYLK